MNIELENESKKMEKKKIDLENEKINLINEGKRLQNEKNQLQQYHNSLQRKENACIPKSKTMPGLIAGGSAGALGGAALGTAILPGFGTVAGRYYFIQKRIKTTIKYFLFSILNRWYPWCCWWINRWGFLRKFKEIMLILFLLYNILYYTYTYISKIKIRFGLHYIIFILILIYSN